MRIGVPAETRAGETRVAATPETVKKLAAKNEVRIQAGAGAHSSYPDADYEKAGAKIVASAAEAFDAEIVLKVRAPQDNEIAFLKANSTLIGLLEPFNATGLEAIAKTGVNGFAMESLPRISRAQSMDVLSSQANIAGYKAVVLAAAEFGKFFPMLMTAAGTVKAARVLVLGAVIEASDVRPAVKEQIESLGAKFLDVPFITDEERQIAKGEGGYARPMPPDWMRRQAEAVHNRAVASDIIITTALIPGRPAPKLIRDTTVAQMKPGSVIVDLAAEQGGNVEGTEPGKMTVRHGVGLIGLTNLPATVPTDASALLARNLANLLGLMLDAKTGAFKIDREDEIIAGTLVCADGAVLKKGK